MAFWSTIYWIVIAIVVITLGSMDGRLGLLAFVIAFLYFLLIRTLANAAKRRENNNTSPSK